MRRAPGRGAVQIWARARVREPAAGTKPPRSRWISPPIVGRRRRDAADRVGPRGRGVFATGLRRAEIVVTIMTCQRPTRTKGGRSHECTHERAKSLAAQRTRSDSSSSIRVKCSPTTRVHSASIDTWSDMRPHCVDALRWRTQRSHERRTGPRSAWRRWPIPYHATTCFLPSRGGPIR